MLKMTEKSREFLRTNLPSALECYFVKDALDLLYDLIEERGFEPPRFDEYNEFGSQAQKVYDDLYLSNK